MKSSIGFYRRPPGISATILHFKEEDWIGREVYYCPSHQQVFLTQELSRIHTGANHCIAYCVDIVKHWTQPGGELVVEIKQAANE